MKVRFWISLTVLFGSLIVNPALAAGRLSPDAKAHFDAGLNYVDEPTGPKWEEALQEFEAAYAISPAWELKNNIALCALNLERDGEAIAAYQEYLAHGGEKGLSEKHRKQIERDIATLTASLVQVKLHVDAPEGTIVDERKTSKGELRVNRYPFKSGTAELGIHPGSHKISIEAHGRVSEIWFFDAPPASSHEHRFVLASDAKPSVVQDRSDSTIDVAAPPKPNTNTHVPTAVYIGLSATGVFAVAATTTGVLALSKNNDYDHSSDPERRKELKEAGERLVLFTNLGIGAAIVSAGATAFFYFSGSRPTPTEPPRATSGTTTLAALRIDPMVRHNAAGVSIGGNF
ncbi:MAG TPA: hypothetical protein VKP30_32650 [Polyangiaceae bacterium]|nr:hypothetical protein [Polyangiaceae bacterium]